jgi:hypothetical protein
MIRNLKALGLAVFAAMAFGAIFANAASAQGGVLTVGETPNVHKAADLHAVQYGDITENIFTAFGQKIHCTNTKTSFSASTEAGTIKQMTVTPDYKGCFVPGPKEGHGEDAVALVATVDFEECDYTFNQPTHVSNDTTWDGTVNLVCPDEQAVRISIFFPIPNEPTNDTDHGITKLCEITLEEQGPLGGVEYHNVDGEPDDVTVTIDTTEEILATEAGLCGAGEDPDASYVSNLTLTSDNNDVWISTGNEGEEQ